MKNLLKAMGLAGLIVFSMVCGIAALFALLNLVDRLWPIYGPITTFIFIIFMWVTFGVYKLLNLQRVAVDVETEGLDK